MNFYLVTALTFCIFIPGIAALIFFKKMDKSFYPFLFCLWAGCVNEILSFILAMNGKQTLVNSNIYVLIESLLLSWYFNKNGVFEKEGRFVMVICSLLLFWLGENFVFSSLTVNSTYFRIFASLAIVVMSIQLMTKILFGYDRNILQNSDFILCCCFIIYFTFKAMVQAFVIYGVTRNMDFLMKIYNIMLYINLGVNLLYTLAVLWMPRKARFILPL